MPKGKVPTRIAVGVRVAEKGNHGRVGVVKAAAGKGKWHVLFDGEDDTEEKKSLGGLRIYKEGYGKVATPKKPAKSVKAALPKTGQRKGWRRTKATDNKNTNGDTNGNNSANSNRVCGSSDEGSDVEHSGDTSSNGGSDDIVSPGSDKSSSSGSDCSKSSSDNWGESCDGISSGGLYSENDCAPNEKGLLSAAKNSVKKLFGRDRTKTRKKKLPRVRLEERLSTPRPLSQYSNSSESEQQNDVFVPEEGEDFDNSLEEEEDD